MSDYPMCPHCRVADVQVEMARNVRDDCPHCGGELVASLRACCIPKCGGSTSVANEVPVCDPCGVKIAVLYRAQAARLAPGEDERRRQKDAAERDRAARRAAAEVVYYARLDDDRIKIGYTSSLRTRMQNMRVLPHNLLAIEPGGRSLEGQRHRQFAPYRIKGEEFAPGRDLLAHIDSLVLENDLPEWTREIDTKAVRRRQA